MPSSRLMNPGLASTALLLGGAAVLASCGAAPGSAEPARLPEAPAPQPAARNLILVSLDTLRADRLGAYGYPRPTSPALDGLAARGARFQEVIAEASWTLPSHMSLFTGLYPSAHTVTHAYRRLPQEVTTLPEILRRRHYRTFGFTGGRFVDGDFGFSRGFELYDDATLDFRDALSKAARTIESLQSDERYFVFVHTYDIHCPYYPPLKYREMFFDAEHSDPLDTRGKCGNPHYNAMHLTDRQVRYLSDMYDGSIRAADDALGKFVAWLDRRGELDRTLLAVISDHGEEFREHGQIGHERTLYIESLRVPWILVGPGVPAGAVIRRPAGLTDVLPTMAGLMGFSAGETQGEDLGPWIRGAAAEDPDRPRFSELDRHWEIRSLVAGPLHLIEDRTHGRRELYHWREDPREGQDLAGARAGDVRRLAAALAEIEAAALRRAPAPRQAPLSQEQRERLRSLGYVD